METVTVTVGGGRRQYLLYRPAGGGLSRPAVVFLHGTGGTAAWAADETGLAAAADRHGFVLAVPDGLPLDPARPPKFLTNPQRWNDGSTRPGDPLHNPPDDVGFLAAVVADVVDRGPADAARVCVSGFSNGAGMAFRFAAERADLVAAVAPVAGHCWVHAPKPARPVPTFYLIGTADPLIPLRGGQVRSPWGGKLARRPAVAETLETWAAGIGCATTPQLVSDGGVVREDRYPGPVEFRAVTVAGLGHHWPGGRGQLNPRIGGPPSNVVNANDLIWDFFQRHAR